MNNFHARIKVSPAQLKRGKVTDVLFEMHNEINKAIGLRVERIMRGNSAQTELPDLRLEIGEIASRSIARADAIRIQEGLE